MCGVILGFPHHGGREVFENRVLKKVLRPKTVEVLKGRRKSRKEELRDLYSSLDIIWGIKKKKRV